MEQTPLDTYRERERAGSGGICKHGTGISRLVQEGEFLGQLSYCPFLKRGEKKFEVVLGPGAEKMGVAGPSNKNLEKTA
jgi:hypothetical protein